MTTEQVGGQGGTTAASPEERIERRLPGTVRHTPAMGGVSRDRPLSSGQQQMWVLYQIDPASPAYLMSWTLRLSGALDAEAMRWAWERVLHRHEILRTRYSQPGDEPAQRIDRPGRFELRVVDLSREPAVDRADRALQIAKQERQRPFDLVNEHPLRVTLIRVADADHLLVIATHHIAFDGVSYQRIAAELSALYAEHVTGRPAGLPEISVQYADYAAWERAQVSSGALRSHLEYWRHRLDSLPELALPTDRPRPTRPDWRGGAVEIPIAADLSEDVRHLAFGRRASPYMVMLAAYQAMLSQLSGDADVAVGTPVAMHSVPAFDHLIGYTINTVVIRTQCSIEGSFADLLEQVKERSLEALDHRAAPFKLVVDELRPSRRAVSNPLFRVAFDMSSAEDGAFNLPGLDVEHVRHGDWELSKFDLAIHVEEAATGRLSAYLEFARALIDEATARHFASYYERTLAAVVRNPDTQLAHLLEPYAKRRPPVGSAAGGVDEGPLAGELTTAADAEPDAELLDTLNEVWREVLQVDHVDPDDNFFDIGGDSVRAVALAGRLRTQRLDVSAADIFAHQTVNGLAGILKGRGRAEVPTGTPPFSLVSQADRNALPPGVVDAYPVGAAQLGMIVEMLARPDLNRYQDTTSFLIRGDGDFAPAAFQAAVQLVVDRHEVLRTTFDLGTYSVPLQLVHRDVTAVGGVTHHGVLDPDGWEPRLRAYSAEQRRRPMDLAEAPLVRIHAHTASGTDDWWLSITECHPVLEGWGFHSLLMEILSCYQDIRVGRSPATPAPVPFRYADYIAAEVATLRSEEDRAYWRGIIQGVAPFTLPSAWRGDEDAPEERYQHSVPFYDLEGALRKLAAETRTSLKAVLLAAHLKVMSSVAGAEDLFTGLVCDARPEMVGADQVPGFYLNTLPFVVPTGARTWGDLVRVVYDGLTAMWPHRRFPMQVIQQEFAHGSRLIDVMFNYLDFHQVDKELVHWEETIDETANEFALHVFTISGRRSGVLRLNTTTYALSHQAAQRLGEMYRAVLEDMARGPHGDATSACLAPGDAEWLRAHGTGPVLDSEPGTVLESFAEWVRVRPDAIAVRHGPESLTYAQLDAAAQRVATQLRRVGMGPGRLVAVALRRDLAMPVALLGVWKAGGTWMALDRGASAERRRSTARDARAGAIIEPAADGQDAAAVTVVDLTGTGSSGGGRAGGHQGAACILAGTRTAARSGAVISHRALAYALASVRAGLRGIGSEPTQDSVWLFSSVLTSHAALTELFLPMTTGGQLVVSAEAVPDRGSEPTFVAGAVTHLQATPVLADQAVSGLSAGSQLTLMVGCEPLVSMGHPADTVADGHVVQAGGVEELPGWLTFQGRPLPGLSLRVVDPKLRQVPVGVCGELCVSGPVLPDAYHGDPAGTAEHFAPDPDGRSGARLLRTGQLARFRENGQLEHLGPIECQTSPDTGLVDLSQIRDALCVQPAVRDAYVLLRPGLGDGRRLVGYVRPAPGAAFDAARARRSIADRLPRRLVPDVLVPVEAWPLTRDGQIDPDSLPEPSDRARAAAGAYDKPWDEQFETLLRAVLPFLGEDDELSADLELVAAGLDSLSTVELIISLEHAYNISISDDRLVLDMFETPATLWEEISSLLATSPAAFAAEKP